MDSGHYSETIATQLVKGIEAMVRRIHSFSGDRTRLESFLRAAHIDPADQATQALITIAFSFYEQHMELCADLMYQP